MGQDPEKPALVAFSTLTAGTQRLTTYICGKRPRSLISRLLLYMTLAAQIMLAQCLAIWRGTLLHHQALCLCPYTASYGCQLVASLLLSVAVA